jgi:hypothetical protein
MLTQVITKVQSRHTSQGFEEGLGHGGIVDLINHHVESIGMSQGIHLQLPTPHPILLHVVAVLLNGLVVLNERHIQVLVLSDIVHGSLSEDHVLGLIATHLIGNGSEETVAIPIHFLDLEAVLAELLLELLEVLVVGI